MVTDEILTYTAPATKHPFLQISVNGDSPGGTMQIKLFPDKVCPGFLEKGVISILYNIPNGIQKDCHPHPGVAYDGFPKRIAYLPNTFEGRNLLSRFKVCFTRGFMFKVGRSLASGNDHQVTWTTIPNKTSLHGGAFGYPDYNYLDVANRKLDQIRIPNSSDCLAILQQGFSDQDTVGNNDIDGSSYDVQSETIIYDAPKSLLDNKRFEDILKPILIQSMPCSPSAPSIDDKVLSQKSSPPCFAPTSTTSSDLMPSGSIAQQPSPSAPSFASTTTSSLGKVQTGSMMLPATIITADDLMNNPTMNTRGTPLIPVHKNIESSSATKSMSTSSIADAGCPICLDKLFTEASVEISICRHAFHRACIIDALNHIDKCPICRKPISGKPQGKSPSGRMKVDILYTSVCPGFNGCNTISIVYDLPSGVQTNYHESPGEEYHGTSRIAYLPNNLQGKLLLKRLKYAFRHGLTFQVGTSLTSGRKNQITWTSIHHKTSLYRGTHGFPDPDYISNCNSSLDALNVPQAGQC